MNCLILDRGHFVVFSKDRSWWWHTTETGTKHNLYFAVESSAQRQSGATCAEHVRSHDGFDTMNIQQRKKAEIRREERYLLSRGWKVERHPELAEGRDRSDWRNWYDLDTWIAPRDYNYRFDPDCPTITKGKQMSRMGAMSVQCNADGHRKPVDYKGPLNMPLMVCPRCKCCFGIGHVSNKHSRPSQ